MNAPNDARTLQRRHELPIALAVAAIYLVLSLFQEKINHCNGFGDDGCLYGTWAMDFPAHAFEARLGSYQIQRALPSLVAWGALKLLHLPHDPPHVVRAFQAMNTACIFTGAFFWLKIARHLAIRVPMTLLGTLGLFGFYGIVKFTTWYPVLGDLWGYALGFVLLWAHLERRFWALIPAAIIGAFTWPSLVAPALLLMFFWNARPAPAPAPLRLNVVVALAAALGWALFVSHLQGRGYWPPSMRAVETMPYVFRLSVIAAGAYFFFALVRLADHRSFFDPKMYLRALLSPHAVAALGLAFALRWALARWSVPEQAGFGRWFNDTAVLSVTKPGIFGVAHAVYFGPLVIALAVRFRAVVDRVLEQGVGLGAAVVLAVLFGVDSEARHAYTFVALVLPFAVKALDEANLDERAIAILAVISVVASKLWLTLPVTVGYPAEELPNQLAFLSQGPWMSDRMYFLQGAVTIAIGVWLSRAIRQGEPAAAVTPRAS